MTPTTICSCGDPMLLERGVYQCSHCDAGLKGHIVAACRRCRRLNVSA